MSAGREEVRPKAATWHGVVSAVWLAIVAVVLFSALQTARDFALRVEEYPLGSDAFVYLRMAKEVRAAAAHRRWPQFQLRTTQTRTLIDFMKAQGVPRQSWEELVGPHGHHYFARTNETGPNPPPGTGFALALFPEGRAVHGLSDLYSWVFGGVGVMALLIAGLLSAPATLGLMVLALELGLEVLGRIGAESFSINAVMPPLLLAVLCALAALSCRDRQRHACAVVAASCAGLLLGLAVVIRLPSVLLAPGLMFLLLPGHRTKGFLRLPIAFLAGLFATGVAPVLVNQQLVAGSWYSSTYNPAFDGTRPELGVIPANIRYYLWGGPGASDNWALLVATVAFAAFVAWTRDRDRQPADPPQDLTPARVATSAFLLWAVPLAFFLTHRITVTYYAVPSGFAAIAMLSCGAGVLDVMGGRARPRPVRVRHPALAGVLLLGLVLPCAVALTRAWGFAAGAPSPFQPIAGVHPPVVLPAELSDGRTWIWADLLSGTIQYYSGKPAFKVTFSDPQTRLLLYRFVFDRGDRQYLLRDSLEMARIQAEIESFGGTVERRGYLEGVPYFAINWRAAGPLAP